MHVRQEGVKQFIKTMSITITDSAKSQLSNLCQTTNKLVRLEIRSGGCQGFSKVWDTVDAKDDLDIEFKLPVGSLVIDTTSLDILDGAVIDYKKDIAGSYFAIDIPSAQSTCGCGTSFSL